MKTRLSPTGKGSVLSNGRAVAVPTFTDRHVDTLAVSCPVCGAEAGSRCVSSRGLAITSHPPRRRMALRAERAEYSAEDVRFAQSLSSDVRRAVRIKAGRGQRELAAELNLSPSSLFRWEQGICDIAGGPAAARYGKWLREAMSPQTPARFPPGG